MAKNHEKNFEYLQKFLLIRSTDEEIAKRYSEWKMRCPTHLSVGQEMVSACLEECFKTRRCCCEFTQGSCTLFGERW